MFKTQPYKLAALREWNIRMSRFDTPAIFDPVVSHVLQEQGFDARESQYYEPRSVYKVEKLFQQLETFDPSGSVSVNLKDKHVQRGIAFAFSVFGKPRDWNACQPLQYWDENIISNWKGSAGLTAFGQTKREALSRGILSAERILKKERKPEPCIALTRTSKGDKTRLVWGYPMSMTLLEGCFARPLLTEFKGGITPMAFAKTNKRLGMEMISAGNSNSYWYSLDASQFDATIQKPMINVAFSIIRSWFDCEAQFCDMDITVGDVLRIIEEYFIYTPIVMPAGDDSKAPGVLFTGKKHGVPSGSYFTQLVDSIVNIIVLGTLASKFGFKVSRYDAFVLGDDLLFYTNTHLNMSEMAAYASATFAMKFNEKKCAMGRHFEPVKFLGREWVKGLPTRETAEAIKRMVYPESYRKYSNPKKEGKLVILSYNLSAIQSAALIPDQDGWRAKANGELLSNSTSKLNGLTRYKMRYHSQKRKNSGYLNLLDILNL